MIFKNLLFIFTIFSVVSCKTENRNRVQEVLPTAEQIAWHEAEVGVIIHLDINIYAPETFDYKKRETLPDVNLFNPQNLNTDQWIETAKNAGAKYAILTAKHGTGFCLWPSLLNTYNVAHTKWRNGQADIVRDFIASCKKYGLKPGLYYNTNMNAYQEAGFGKIKNDVEQKEYNKYVLGQLAEIWSNYGDLFEIWFDGGIMTDETNGIESQVIKLLDEKQPQAILFQGPSTSKNIVRWVGNEDGVAAYPQWSRTNVTTSSNGVEKIDGLHGDPQGKIWCPAESDFPNRRNSAWNGGWLWKEGEDSMLFSVDELIDKYDTSVGRNTNMLIGMVIDKDGLVPKADSVVFGEFGKSIHSLFSNPVAEKRGINQKETEINLSPNSSIQRIVIQEDISKGENIRAYSFEAFVDGEWKPIAEGTSVGHKRIQKFSPVIASKIRFTVTESASDIFIKQLSIY